MYAMHGLIGIVYWRTCIKCYIKAQGGHVYMCEAGGVITWLMQAAGYSSLFLTTRALKSNFVQLIKLSQVFIRPTGIQALPKPVNSLTS